ncbi:hypothetical protein ISG33_00555 [Glaciecola sp. MH2013]|uniref:hypothetical protein n=1 Tax=Glaciecola sp. MH2013 TaxID=2785524 RepID=UPI00189CFF9A|nr:hypothetical protein [Glaciecola sp. MH2013]MBF7071887.1 hypothetical protein [Glaciecola sp. MH2013]
MEDILPKITENMQLIYRKSLDADKALDQLQKANKGKFTVIFGDDSLFSARKKRFYPYVEELAEDITEFEKGGAVDTEQLQVIIQKIQSMFLTLDKFKSTL